MSEKEKKKNITLSNHIIAVFAMEGFATGVTAISAIVWLIVCIYLGGTTGYVFDQSQEYFASEDGWMGLFSLAGAGLMGFTYIILLIIAVAFIAATAWFLIFTIVSACGRYEKNLFKVCVIIGQAPVAIFGIAAICSGIEMLLFGIILCGWYAMEVVLACLGKWIKKEDIPLLETEETKENREEFKKWK